jgi:ELWxxDGT repeat protein
LWMTSGAEATTALVSDTNSGFAHSHPSDLTVVETRLYFTALDSSGVRGLYYSDSPYTSATAVTVTGADPAPSLAQLTAVGSKLYFVANFGGVPTLYAHGGTGAATKKPETAGGTDIRINTGVDPSILALGDVAIIRGAPIAGVNYELYYSDSDDSTSTSATLLKEINTGATSSPILTEDAIYNDTTLFFTADDGTNGRELWKTNGTPASTMMVRNIYQDSSGAQDSSPTELTVVDDKLFFKAIDGASAVNDAELWVSESPFTDAIKLTQYANDSQIANLYAVGDELLFTASENNAATNGVYKSDGTVAGTVRLRGGIANADTPSFNELYAHVGSVVFFVMNWVQGAADMGKELWVTNGELNGTRVVDDIYPGDADGLTDHDDFANVNDYLIFVANNGSNGDELWVTDGEATTPVMLDNFNPNDHSGTAPQLLGVTSDAAYYLIDDGVSGITIYKIE